MKPVLSKAASYFLLRSGFGSSSSTYRGGFQGLEPLVVYIIWKSETEISLGLISACGVRICGGRIPGMVISFINPHFSWEVTIFYQLCIIELWWFRAQNGATLPHKSGEFQVHQSVVKRIVRANG